MTVHAFPVSEADPVFSLINARLAAAVECNRTAEAADSEFDLADAREKALCAELMRSRPTTIEGFCALYHHVLHEPYFGGRDSMLTEYLERYNDGPAHRAAKAFPEHVHGLLRGLLNRMHQRLLHEIDADLASSAQSHGQR
jgi:hypothetical protein